MEPDYNLIGTSIDLRQVDAISQKRLLAFFNFWLSQTVRLLNESMLQFETALLDLDNRLRRVEASMTLLEAKLASIPGLEAPAPSSATVAMVLVETEHKTNTPAQAEVKQDVSAAKVAEATTEREAPPSGGETTTKQDAPEVVTYDASKDPRYAKYFKMIQMGVPEAAVKQKMELEGIDSSILQKDVTSGAAADRSSAAAATAKTTKKETDNDSDSFDESEGSSFSD